MTLKLVCAACGNEFQTTRKHARTCSAACRKRASRARTRKTPANNRPEIIARALERSAFLLGQLGNTRGLMVPRAVALAELNAFLRLAEPFTDDELKAVLKRNGWRDHGGAK